MSVSREPKTQARLDQLLNEYGLSGETRLYREALRSALTPAGASGAYRLAANAGATESVIDVYGQGYLVQAEQLGPGLAFAESARPDWQETMELRALKARGQPERVEVEVRLADLLEQGGLLYPVESVTVERAWYCTLPSGSVIVREASS